jgi:hypothetical protein
MKMAFFCPGIMLLALAIRAPRLPECIIFSLCSAMWLWAAFRQKPYGPIMSYPDENYHLRVSLIFPFRRKELRQEITLSSDIFACLQPLPREHDCPFAPISQMEALDQCHKRERLLDHVAQQIAFALITEIEKQDPHRGYEAK